MNEERFDKWLQEALASDVQPGDDFTSRVMERVAATPQEPIRTNSADKRKLKRMMTALAACAAIVILVPMGMLMMPKGEKAPAADCAASESFIMDDAAADMDLFVTEHTNGAVDGGERLEEEQTDAGGAPTESVVTDSSGTEQKADAEGYQTMVHLTGDEAAMVRAALAEMGRAPDAVQDIADVYELTAAEADALRELVPGAIEAEGALYLTLELIR